MPLKGRLIRRFHRIVDIEVRTPIQDMNTGHFKPRLSKGQVIHCDFVGNGGTIDMGHYAVVWSADAKSEHIIVIPLTSKGVNPQYSLGIIDSLNKPGDVKESIAKINQIQSVSRKSVHVLTKRISPTEKVPLQLEEFQLKKLEDIFRRYFLKEPLLCDVLVKDIGYRFPLSPLSMYKDFLNRPVQYIHQEDQLWCRTYEAKEWTIIELFKVKGITSAQRKNYLFVMFDADEEKEKEIRSIMTEIQRSALSEAAVTYE